MPERTYIVTYIAADGNQKTQTVVGKNHLTVERFIKEQGGTVLHIDRDESEPMTVRPFGHMIKGIVFFVIAALAVVAYYWYRHR